MAASPPGSTPPDPVPPDRVPPDPVSEEQVPPEPVPRWRRLLSVAAAVLYAVGELLTDIRLPRLPRRRRRRSEPSPERHPRETSAAMATARRYEHMGRQDFEARVAAESGTRGWENLCILVVVLGVASSAVLIHRAGYASQSLYVYALSGACACWLPARWYLHRRRTRTSR